MRSGGCSAGTLVTLRASTSVDSGTESSPLPCMTTLPRTWRKELPGFGAIQVRSGSRAGSGQLTSWQKGLAECVSGCEWLVHGLCTRVRVRACACVCMCVAARTNLHKLDDLKPTVEIAPLTHVRTRSENRRIERATLSHNRGAGDEARSVLPASSGF